jgi:hypothetical protein
MVFVLSQTTVPFGESHALTLRGKMMPALNFAPLEMVRQSESTKFSASDHKYSENRDGRAKYDEG